MIFPSSYDFRRPPEPSQRHPLCPGPWVSQLPAEGPGVGSMEILGISSDILGCIRCHINVYFHISEISFYFDVDFSGTQRFYGYVGIQKSAKLGVRSPTIVKADSSKTSTSEMLNSSHDYLLGSLLLAEPQKSTPRHWMMSSRAAWRWKIDQALPVRAAGNYKHLDPLIMLHSLP